MYLLFPKPNESNTIMIWIIVMAPEKIDFLESTGRPIGETEMPGFLLSLNRVESGRP